MLNCLVLAGKDIFLFADDYWKETEIFLRVTIVIEIEI